MDEDGNVTAVLADPEIDNATDCADAGDYGGYWIAVTTVDVVNGDDPGDSDVCSYAYGGGDLLGTQCNDGPFVLAGPPVTNQDYIKAIARALPTLCSVGVFYYSGREYDTGVANGFMGAISEYDSKTGSSGGALVELGAGEGVVGGGGMIVAPNGKGGLGSTGLIYGGAGIETPVASASIDQVGFESGVGFSVEGQLFGQGAGFGAYVSVTPAAGCHQ